MFKQVLYSVVAAMLCFSQSLFASQNFQLIHLQAELSNHAYLEQDELEANIQLIEHKLIHHSTIEESQVNYFLSESDGVQTIAIRGTANLNNVILDLSVSLTSDDVLGIKLHHGFASGSKAVFEDLLPYLSKDKPVFITGHSLGGAIAVILAMQLQKEGYPLQQVVTFGQPKVTNVSGAKAFSNLPLIRIVTPEDIVPLVPPISPLQIKDLDIYWHMGIEVILRGEGEYAETRGIKSALRATKFSNALPSEKNLQAHKMASYLQLVNELAIESKEVPYQSEISLFGLSFD
ncbi:lipase family protein [Marinomonas sp. C2222]|uniref:Lipase family protein n=1 Tax=Marinomonas sargassi TaxID=2984494 RepID=A0ABT2YSZ4_9GAMM|nr:lipase family protein [Marinomonas sargassi]MCV2403028.1 lipase family protein [Marinomonas sargassi]